MKQLRLTKKNILQQLRQSAYLLYIILFLHYSYRSTIIIPFYFISPVERHPKIFPDKTKYICLDLDSTVQQHLEFGYVTYVSFLPIYISSIGERPKKKDVAPTTVLEREPLQRKAYECRLIGTEPSSLF